MKKITLLLVIIFTFLFSNTSWGEWKFVTETMNGSKFYYDKDRVRKSGKYLYFWRLSDWLKPRNGGLSQTKYTQLDCSIFRSKDLSIQTHKNLKGEGKVVKNFDPRDKWDYPPPESVIEFLFNTVCEEHQ
jgi:hypothetical protein